MIKFIKNFRKDEDGAVTVDWVVLTAAVIGLGTVAYQQIANGAQGMAADVNTALSSATLNTGTTDGTTAGGITTSGTNGGS